MTVPYISMGAGAPHPHFLERESAMSYIVTVTMNGTKWPLRGTNWAYDMSRALYYPTREEAQAALDRARKFMKPAVYRAAVIEEVTRPAQ